MVVSTVKFRKCFAKFMISIAFEFLSYLVIASVEVSNMARCFSKSDDLKNIKLIGCRARNITI